MGMSNMKKYRFAPSPTGNLHMGSARTAMFNYLLAKNSGSKLVLRIEDTDRQRSTPEFEKNIIDGLKWLGIEWDEFYRQSERNLIYRDYADQLIKLGRAYKKDGAIMFRIDRKEITFNDLVRGNISFNLALQEDFVIIKSDGSPSYQFAVVVDDHDMGITHIVRGEDHISNTPKQLGIYEALGWIPPEYAHISIILGMDKAKLSKRNGAMSVDEFQNKGYLPNAVFNFLALLGWSPDSTNEIFSRDELIDMYTMERVSRSNSIFDPVKLEWMNKEYIKRLTFEELAEFIPNGDVQLAEMIKPKLTTLNDIPKWIKFIDDPVHEGRCPKWFPDFISYVNIHHTMAMDSYATTNGIPKNEMFSAVRYGITAEMSGLGLFQVIDYLGIDEVIRRMLKWTKE